MRNKDLETGLQDFAQLSVVRAWAQEGYDSHHAWADYIRANPDDPVEQEPWCHTLEQHRNWCSFYRVILAALDITEACGVETLNWSRRGGREVVRVDGKLFDCRETTTALLDLLRDARRELEQARSRIAQLEIESEE